MHRVLQIMVVLFVLTLSACAQRARPLFEPLTPGQRAALVGEGREIAQGQCSACHAVGAHDVSARPDAPPLRDVLERYDSAALTGNMMIGVRVGHPDMPLFHMGPRSADALVEYINSLRSRDQTN